MTHFEVKIAGKITLNLPRGPITCNAISIKAESVPLQQLFGEVLNKAKAENVKLIPIDLRCLEPNLSVPAMNWRTNEAWIIGLDPTHPDLISFAHELVHLRDPIKFDPETFAASIRIEWYCKCIKNLILDQHVNLEMLKLGFDAASMVSLLTKSAKNLIKYGLAYLQPHDKPAFLIAMMYNVSFSQFNDFSHHLKPMTRNIYGNIKRKFLVKFKEYSSTCFAAEKILQETRDPYPEKKYIKCFVKLASSPKLQAAYEMTDDEHKELNSIIDIAKKR